MTAEFYDQLAPYYDLIFEDWDASMARQGGQLDSIIQAAWPGARRVLDAAAGIGTQALALAARGYDVTASDISKAAIARAAEEARYRDLPLRTGVADLRSLSEAHGTFDLVLACDNALPHLLTDGELRQALRECFRCTEPGGGCLISVRDYQEPGHGSELRPYGVRRRDGRTYILFQVWRWDGPHYDLDFYVVEDAGHGECHTRVMRSRYRAIPTRRLLVMLQETGFEAVQRLDGEYYQPILLGTRPRAV